MNESNELTSTERLEATKKLLEFLETIPPRERAEVLMLAYHASTSTHDLRKLVSSI